MTATRKGLLLTAIQIVIVLSLSGKLLYDRATRPRVWVQAEAFDPELPIRGRYLSERLQMPAEGFAYHDPAQPDAPGRYTNRCWTHLEVRDGRLIASSQGSGPGQWIELQRRRDGDLVAVSEEPAVLFIPENAAVPGLKAGQEMWIEVTVPRQGPRPIQIGIKQNGVLTPLRFR